MYKRQANTVQKGYDLNTPLQIIMSKNQDANNREQKLPASAQLLNLSAENLILMALKLSADQKPIMRFYEAYGEKCNLSIKSDLDLEIEALVDGLEQGQKLVPDKVLNSVTNIHPYKIKTYRLKTQ